MLYCTYIFITERQTETVLTRPSRADQAKGVQRLELDHQIL